MRPLNIILLSDGRAGHFNLSEGISAAIARRRPVAITRVGIARPRWLPSRALSALTNVGGSLARPVPALLGLDLDRLPPCDLVVSAGGDTLAVNIAVRRKTGCANIFYGSLRRYRPTDFSLVLTSYTERARHPNQVMALKPSAFDPDTFAPSEQAPGQRVTLGLLIGGDSGTVRYDADDWQRLLGLLSPKAGSPLQWMVANSRRTPDSVSDAIAAMAADPSALVTFIDVRTAGPGTLAQLLASVGGIAVTVDSSSMLSEAVWARRPAVALAPKVADLPALEQGYRTYLDDHGWTRTLGLRNATADTVVQTLATLQPLAANPLDNLAGLLQAKVPALFTQPP
jgi:uncharacterized protein